MTRSWLSFLFVIAFGSIAIAQGARIWVSSDAAASHLKSGASPEYPSLAQVARIQGNVILHIAIDPNGNVSPLRVVRGHPLLVPAAISAVRNWKYSPFTANGQRVSVVTVTVVRFGNPANHDAEDKAEVAFQDKFWAGIERVEAALSMGDLSAAEQSLTDGQIALSAGGAPPVHLPERWQWAMSMGDLNRQEKRITDAEQRYTEALALQKDTKDSPEAAASLSALGGLYFESNKSDQSRDRLTKAISIYQKNYKAAARMPTAQDVYARGIANDSWMLSKMAVGEHRQDEVVRQCRVVLNFRKSLGEDDPKVAECERLIAAPPVAL